MHWGVALPNAPAATKQRKKGGDPFFQSSSRKRKALLAAELNKATKARTHAAARSPKQTKPAPMKERETDFQPPQNDKELADVSFAPSFFSPNLNFSLPHQAEAIEPVENSDNVVMQSPAPPQQNLPWMSPPLPPQQQRSWVASPAPTRKSKQMGPLMKRLKAIRSGTEGDAIRLRSGQFPFSVRGMDRNDPRNRATTVCNVTLLGNPIAWGSDSVGEHKSSAGGHHAGNHHRLVTALSYVHSWTRPLVRSTTNDSPGEDMLGLVWAVFTYDKAREQSLGKGTQLRIYNAVGLMPPLGTDGDSERMLLSTNLCEPYPSSSLPPLPDVSGAIGLEASTTL